jgi:predicted N-formylglutamate amidohydrolase
VHNNEEHRAPDHTVVDIVNRGGAGPFVLACDHASNYIPPEFDNLGLDPELLNEHIAWDPGAKEVALEMARLLDALLVLPRVSRLVHDCNRPAGSEDATPVTSENYQIPGNKGLTQEQRQDRGRRFYGPYHQALGDVIAGRSNIGCTAILVTIHSFTPVYKGKTRNVELGIVHDDDARLADALLAVAEKRGEMAAARNRPYGPQDGVTHTLCQHALPLGLLNVMIEIRNDLIADAPAQSRMAQRLSGYLNEALASMDADDRASRHA